MLKLNDTIHPHTGENILTTGQDIQTAEQAIILIHGRGASAESMVPLFNELDNGRLACVIPQASGFTWYPYRFIEKREHNEPGLSSALALIKAIKTALNKSGFDDRNMYLAGFSQGACLVADFAASTGGQFGGIFILSGGLIGDRVDATLYKGDLQGTPVFMGCSDADFHIPEERVHQSADLFKELHAKVTKRIYPGMGHTINEDEIQSVKDILNNQ